MRTDHEIARLKRQMRQGKNAMGIAAGQSTVNSGTSDSVISPSQIDPKIYPTVIDVTTVRTEMGVDYTKNPPDIWIKVYWQGIPNEYISEYELGIAPVGTSDWQFFEIEATNPQYGAGFQFGDTSVGQLPYTIHNLQPAKQYKFKMRAQNISGWWGDWFNEIQDSRFLAPGDTEPPATPTEAPTVSGAVTKLIVEMPIALESDYDLTEVHYSTTQSFTPNDSTLAWTGRGNMCTLDGVCGSRYYVKFRYKDTSGNYSGYSPEGSDLCGFVTNTSLADAAVTTAKLANLSVDVNKLADLAVEASKLANSSVTAIKIANAAVGSAAIAAAAIGTAHIGQAAITTLLVQDGAISNAKIGNLAVDSAKIASGAVTNIKIGNAEITDAKIVSISVSKLVAGTITAQTITLASQYGTNAQIKSENFTPGYSGWAIDSAGNAEFNVMTVRGTIYGESGYFKGDLTGRHMTLEGEYGDSGASLNIRYNASSANYIQILADSWASLYIGHSTSPGGSMGTLDQVAFYADYITRNGNYLMECASGCYQRLQCAQGNQGGGGIGWWNAGSWLGKTYFA